MDEIYNKMESGEAYISSYYAGDFLVMYESNDSLAFLQPDATNFFVDAMCIPATSRNQELANIFINFMLSEEPAVANAEYIYYASPNQLVIESEEYQECMSEVHEDAMEILYPEGLNFKEQYEQYCYKSLDSDTNSLMNDLWSRLKISSGEEETADVTYIIAIVLSVAIVSLLGFLWIRKKRRAKYY